MIQKNETALTQDQYDGLLAAYGDPLARVTLEQYSLSLVAQAGGGYGAANTSFDAIVVDDVIVRVWATTNTITVEALASEDAGDESWSSQNLTATSIVTAVNPTLAASGDTVRVFWYDGTNIKYFESTDKGTSWGAAQTVYADANVHLLAATSLTKFHLFTEVSGGSFRLHVGEYNGSWSQTDSDIYWTFEPASFDAISVSATDDAAAATSDILAFATDFPPMVRVGVEITELTHDYERVRGIAIIRYQNGRWSNHYHLDVVDDLYESSERAHVRLSSYDDLLFLAYRRDDGDADYPHNSVAISRSKTGIHWEQPYLLGSIADAPVVLAKRGDHAYIVSAEDTLRSPSVGYTGDSKVTQDITSRVVSLTSRMGDIKEIQIAIADPEGILDNTSPISDDVSMQAIIEEGWVVGGTNLFVQTAIVDIDTISQALEMPTSHKVLAGRDVLGRLTFTNADYVQEWPSQQISGDSYQGYTDSKYSGMHHTAAIAGHWETEDNTLKLSSNKTPGVALHTGVSNAWNGSVRAKCRADATDSEDFVGVCFRAYDQNNLWYAAYEADSDTIRLVERRLGIDTVKVSTGAMGWSHNTYYGLGVDFKYNLLKVYGSTDFVEYMQELTYTMQGVSVPGSVWGDIPILTGEMGYIGFGFTQTTVDGYTPVPPPIPWPSDPVVDASTPYNWAAEVYVGTWDMGIYHTFDFTEPDDPAQPTWTPVNAGLPSTIVSGNTRYLVRQFLVDWRAPRDYQYCLMGSKTTRGDLYRRSFGGTWEVILTTEQAQAMKSAWPETEIYWVAVDDGVGALIEPSATLYALIGTEKFPNQNAWVIVSYDRGDTWEEINIHYQGLNDTINKFIYEIGTLTVYGATMYISWSHSSPTSGVISVGTLIDISNPDPITGQGSASGWVPHFSYNRKDPSSFYWSSNPFDTGTFDFFYRGPAPNSWLPPSPFSPPLYRIGPFENRNDAVWHSPNINGTLRLVDNDDRLWTRHSLSGGWSFYGTLSEPSVGVIAAASIANDDLVLLGKDAVIPASPEHIFVISDETSTTLISKSGVDPENDLTTVSIPHTGDGVCFGGIYAIPAVVVP